jgi:HEAT repeat protein
VYQNQCPVVHKQLIAGTCPWCGCAIIRGQIASLPLRGFAAAIGMLIRMLQVAELRHDAVDSLGTLGPEAMPAVAALAALLDDKDEVIRKAAREALEKNYLLAIIEECGPHAEKAIPLLRVALKDSAWSVRFAAANALARIGPSAKEALPALHRLLQDSDQLVRDSAAEAIKSIEK